MKHYYTQRRYNSNTFKIHCTDEWFLFDGSKWHANHPTTAMVQVTCPQCLQILIAKLEGQLDEMRKTRAGRVGVPITGWKDGPQEETPILPKGEATP